MPCNSNLEVSYMTPDEFKTWLSGVIQSGLNHPHVIHGDDREALEGFQRYLQSRSQEQLAEMKPYFNR